MSKNLTDSDFDFLIKAFMSGDSNARDNAAWDLGELGDRRAVEPLIAALNDHDWGIRLSAAKALGKLGDSRAVKALVVALNDEESDVRRYAAEALGNIDDTSSIKALKKALKDENDEVQRSSLLALTKLGIDGLPFLTELLKDPDSKVRKNTAYTLGDFPDRRTVALLIEALSDDNDEVGQWASYALGKLGEPAVLPLIEALNSITPVVQKNAAYGLSYIHDPRAIAPLIRLLENEDSRVRGSAAYALGEIGNELVIPALEKLKYDTGVIGKAWQGVVKDKAIEAITKLMQ